MFEKTVGVVKERKTLNRVEFLWVIRGFFDLPCSSCYRFFSPVFCFEKQEWRMRMRPTLSSFGQEMSVFLQRKGPACPPRLFRFTLGIRREDEFEAQSVSGACVLEEEFSFWKVPSGPWVWLTSLRRSKLEKEAEVLLPGGCLTIFCEMSLGKPFFHCSTMPHERTVGRLSEEMHPDRVEFLWTIEGFPCLMRQRNYPLTSPVLHFLDQEWRLVIRPTQLTLDQEFLLELERKGLSPAGYPHHLGFTLGVKNVDGAECRQESAEFNLEREFSDWDKLDTWNMCLRWSDLKSHKLLLLPDDRLTLSGRIILKGPPANLSRPVLHRLKIKQESGGSASGEDEETLPSKGVTKILEDLGKLFSNEVDSDLIVRVQGVELKAHKLILCARSPVFRAMLHQNTEERKTSVVCVENCKPDVFRELLNYVYTGRPRELTAQNACSLYNLADKFKIEELKTECLECARQTLSVDTFFDVMTLALRNNETELVEGITLFFVENAEEIVESEGWQAFSAVNAAKCRDLFLAVLRSDGRKRKKQQ